MIGFQLTPARFHKSSKLYVVAKAVIIRIVPRKASPPASLEIRLFGSFRISVDGAKIDERRWTRRKPKQLVKLLALQPHHQLHREQAMEMLWPELDAARAANNLHKTIHVARRALEMNLTIGADSCFICTQDHQIALRAPRTLWIDTEAFEEQAAAALRSHNPEFFEAALEIYQDDLLSEDPYEDWAAARREQLRATFHNLLARLAEIYETERQYARSIECLKRLVTRDLADEEAHRELMRLYVLTGSRHLASLQYRLCAESLKRELGAEPEAETVELHKQIIAGAIQPLIQHERRANVAPSYHQLTFRRGSIDAARFYADARTVLYSAAWNGEQTNVFRTRTERPESHSLEIEGAGLLAVSRSGALVVALNQLRSRGDTKIGTCARMSLASNGADRKPQILANDVQCADWSPRDNEDEARLAIVREAEGRTRLEFPIGTILYEASGFIGHPRISPDGKRIAFIDHPAPGDDRGSIAVIDVLDKQKRTLSAGWTSARGLAWNATGEEVWFTATDAGNARALYAVTLTGHQRIIERIAGSLTLHDISPEGQMLLTRDQMRVEMAAVFTDKHETRDLSWLDWTLARDISADGRIILFTEASEGGSNRGVYVRETASAARRIGDGSALALSPDGRWALARSLNVPAQLILLPVGEGELPRVLPPSPINYQSWACWLPDGERIILAGNESNRGAQLFIQHIARGKPRTITPHVEGVHLPSPHAVSPDGERVVALASDETAWLFPIAGGAAHKIEGLNKGDVPIRWSADGKHLLFRRGEMPVEIHRLSLKTKRTTLWKSLMPTDAAGVSRILRVIITPDEKTCVYSYARDLSELYLVYGLK